MEFEAKLLKRAFHDCAWISPQGDVEELGDEDHGSFAETYLGQDRDDHDVCEILERKGWRRMGVFSGAGAYFSSTRALSQGDLETFQAWLQEDPRRIETADGWVSLSWGRLSSIDMEIGDFLAVNRVSDLLRQRRGLTAGLLKRAFVEQELAWLKDSLTMSDDKKGEDLIREFPWEFEKWVKSVRYRNGGKGVGVDPMIFADEDWYMDEDVLGTIPEASLVEFAREFTTEDPEAPLYTIARFERVIKNQWLVHYTDHAYDVAYDGFTKGVALDEWNKLGLSTNFNKHKGFNFAYTYPRAQYREGKKYGKEAVVFRASGIEIEHYGDQEDQVIFIGATATDIVPINESYGEFLVNVGDREMKFGDCDDAVDWIVANYTQYGAKLLPGRGKSRKEPGKRFLETPR